MPAPPFPVSAADEKSGNGNITQFTDVGAKEIHENEIKVGLVLVEKEKLASRRMLMHYRGKLVQLFFPLPKAQRFLIPNKMLSSINQVIDSYDLIRATHRAHSQLRIPQSSQTTST